MTDRTTWETAEVGHRVAVEYARRKLAGAPVPEAPVHVGVLLTRALGHLGHE